LVFCLAILNVNDRLSALPFTTFEIDEVITVKLSTERSYDLDII
jgi:hypothetical protein